MEVERVSQRFEKLHLKNSTAKCLSRDNAAVTLDNPHTSLSTDFIGNTFRRPVKTADSVTETLLIETLLIDYFKGNCLLQKEIRHTSKHC